MLGSLDGVGGCGLEMWEGSGKGVAERMQRRTDRQAHYSRLLFVAANCLRMYHGVAYHGISLSLRGRDHEGNFSREQTMKSKTQKNQNGV